MQSKASCLLSEGQGAPVTEFSYKSLLPVRCLNDQPGACSQMAVKNSGKESKVESAGQAFHMKTLPKEIQSLYKSGEPGIQAVPSFHLHSGICPNNKNR